MGGSGLWTVNYTATQSFIHVIIIIGLKTLGTLNLDPLVQYQFQIFELIILIYSRGNHVYHQWGCTSIYPPLSIH